MMFGNFFGGKSATEEAMRRKELEERAEKEDAVRKAFLTSDEYSKRIIEGMADGLSPEEFAHKAVHLEEDEEYVMVEPLMRGPTGLKGTVGCSDPALGAMESGYTSGMSYGVPNKVIQDLRKLSTKTGVKPEILLSVLEDAISEIPDTLLREMKLNA